MEALRVARVEPSLRGLWVRGGGRGRWVPWSRLLLLPLLTALAVAVFMVWSFYRIDVWARLTMGWIRYFHRIDNRVARRRLILVAEWWFWRNQRAALDHLLWAELPPRDSALPTLRVYLAEDSLRSMLAHAHRRDGKRLRLHENDNPEARGLVASERGVLRRATLSLRGTSYWHHMDEKPSLRVKFRKGDLELGSGPRTLDLQRPEDTLAFQVLLGERLARSLGVMAGRSRPVRLFLNGKYRGVYLAGCRPGEDLARANGRLPGVFFKGDRFDKQAVWTDLTGWASFPPCTAEENRRLADLLQAVREWSREPRPEAVGGLLDGEVCARWAAVVIHAGTTHVDNGHNQLFFYSPFSGRMEPVVWDLNGYGTMEVPRFEVNAAYHDLYKILMQDPAWVHRRNLALYELVRGAGSVESVQALLDRHLARVGPDLRADRCRGELVRVFGRPGVRQDVPLSLRAGLCWLPNTVGDLEQRHRDLLAWVAARDQYLLEFLGDCRVSLDPGQRTLVVYGNVAVRVEEPGQPDRLFYPGLGSPEFRDFTPVYPPAAQDYPFAGGPEVKFYNAVTGEPVLPGPVPIGRASFPTVNLREPEPRSNLQEPEPRSSVRLGPGPVLLRRDLVVGPGQTLVVAPGTRLHMGPGVRIVSRGVVRARGTAEQPIELEGSQPGKPWGGLAILGPQTAGSRLSHLRLGGAEPGWFEGVRMQGGLSVYRCPRIDVENCTFEDEVSLADSVVTLQHGRFTRRALRLDACRGLLRDCEWSGGGLESSGSHLALESCRIERCRERGLRVGAASRLRMTGGEVASCAVGVQVEDDSRARLESVELRSNHLAVEARRQDTRFARGGRVVLCGCRLSGSGSPDLRVDRWSEVFLWDTPARLPGAPSPVHVLSELRGGWRDPASPFPRDVASPAP